MRKSIKIIISALIISFLIAVLFVINRDLYHFTYETQIQRLFNSELAEKQDYIVNGPVTLKPGKYFLSLKLTVEGNGNGLFLIDGDDQEFFYEDLPSGTKDPSIPFEINTSAKQVRIGIRYDGGESVVNLEWITITSDHVLYRESIAKHLTISLFVILLASCLAIRLLSPKVIWKVFPFFSKPQNELSFLFLILLTAGACWPILGGKIYIHGNDMFYHATRIRGLADSLRAGYFPVRDQLYWLHNYGYGVSFFYPDVFLYFPAILVLLGFNLLTSYNIFLVICSFFSVFSIWFVCERITKNRLAALTSAVFMAFSAYRLITVYYRAAIGEVQAAIFYPVIFYGLYEIFHNHEENWGFFAFGFFGLLCCHMISLAIGIFITALFLIVHIRQIVSDRRIIAALIKSVLLVIGIGAFFWIPMLEQSITNPQLNINQVLSGSTSFNATNYAIPIRNLFIRYKPWSSMLQADSVYPGWSFLLIVLFGVLLGRKRGKMVKSADIMLVYSLPFLWMCTRAFPWRWNIFQPFVIRIQFAYRFLLPVSTLFFLAGGIYFSALTEKYKKKTAAVPAFVVLMIFCFFTTAYPILNECYLHRSVEKRMFVMQDNRVSGGEYMPKGLDNDYPDKNADTVRLVETDIPLSIPFHKRQKLGFTFSYELPKGSGEVHFSVPLIHYTGFQAVLTADDGTVLYPKIKADDRGLVSLSNEGFDSGTVSVFYQKTICQWISEGITLLTFIAFVIWKRRLFTSEDGKTCFSL